MSDSPSSSKVLIDRNYRWYLIGNFSSSVGLWTQRTAIGWLTWELTHSTTWLGIIALAETGPTIALGLYAGSSLASFSRGGTETSSGRTLPARSWISRSPSPRQARSTRSSSRRRRRREVSTSRS